jgi:hypothetical protein
MRLQTAQQRHYGGGHTPAAPAAHTNSLQEHFRVHQQLQRGHELCMRSAVQSRQASGDTLNAAAQVKLAELLAVQQMQMELQEELLMSLAP